MSSNDITGARLVSKAPTTEYKDNWDRIFGKKKQSEDCACGEIKYERCIIHDNENEVIND